jgi:hypothetical protein
MVASQHPLRIGLTQSPLKTSAVLMFLLFCTYPALFDDFYLHIDVIRI